MKISPINKYSIIIPFEVLVFSALYEPEGITLF
jgi:hypothetical protein